MRTITVVMVFFAALLCFSTEAEAQKRRPAKRPAAKPTPKPTPRPPAISSIERAAVQLVSNQQFNVTRFVDILGPVAAAIENIDKTRSTTRLSQKVLDDNEKNKKDLIGAITDLRAVLVNLENEFRSKPELRKYLPQIQGISQLSAQSEDLALAGKFVESRKPLVTVGAKLSDTLAVMPKTAGASPTRQPVRAVNQPVSAARPVNTGSQPTGSKRNVAIGMTREEVRASIWGEPTSVDTRDSATLGSSEWWNYSGGRSLYFKNGKLSVIKP